MKLREKQICKQTKPNRQHQWVVEKLEAAQNTSNRNHKSREAERQNKYLDGLLSKFFKETQVVWLWLLGEGAREVEEGIAVMTGWGSEHTIQCLE